MDQITIENGVANVQQLPAINDEFGGVMVEMEEHMDPDVFCTLLKTSMTQWKLQGKKGVWIKLPIELSNLVDTAVKEGFWYHHAEPKYLMLLYWIPKTINPIPANASHIVRVGAIVLNDRREMLVVQEKMGPLQGVWKISTGTVHEGEDISVGVVREVKEETGIDTEFVEILAFSQEHNVFFGKSEVFFLCMMRTLSFDIQIQETEIQAAKWMPLEEYAAQSCAEEQDLRNYITELCIAKLERDYPGFSPFRVTNFNVTPEMLFAFFTALCLVGSGVIMVSSDTAITIHCEYPCQPTPPLPPPSSRPLYGTPPPTEPVYEAPPSATEPLYAPSPPTCEPPPSPTAPLYGVPPTPGNCQPSMQNCVYAPPNTNMYRPIDSASDVPLYCLHILALMSLIFLPWLIC